MRISRKAFALRFFFLYLPLMGFFGWRACSKYQQQHAAEINIDDPTTNKTRTIQLPDGRTINVIEISPEEAKHLVGDQAHTE